MGWLWKSKPTYPTKVLVRWADGTEWEQVVYPFENEDPLTLAHEHVSLGRWRAIRDGDEIKYGTVVSIKLKKEG